MKHGNASFIISSHNDLTGTSIPRAYEFSWNDELISLKQFSNVLTSSIHGIGRELDTRVSGIPVILYNALGFTVTDIAEIELDLPKAPKGITVYDEKGKKVSAQLISYTDGKARILVEATVPATGYVVYEYAHQEPVQATSATNVNTLENSLYKITLDKNGDIVSLLTKRTAKSW